MVRMWVALVLYSDPALHLRKEESSYNKGAGTTSFFFNFLLRARVKLGANQVGKSQDITEQAQALWPLAIYIQILLLSGYKRGEDTVADPSSLTAYSRHFIRGLRIKLCLSGNRSPYDFYISELQRPLFSDRLGTN